MRVRHCEECDTEFMPHVERCSDCGGALVDREEREGDAPPEGGPEGRGPAGRASGLPAGEYLALLQRERAAELDPLAERLAEAGLPYRVDVRPGFGFELRVRREERDAALTALDDLLGARDGAAPADPFDGEGWPYVRCPACEAELPAAARECPECGLLLAAETAHCASCGAELDPATARCLRCEGAPKE